MTTSPESATTQLRDQDEPARLRGPAVARYTDALNARVDHALGTQAGTWARFLPTLDPASARDPARLTIARRLHQLEHDSEHPSSGSAGAHPG